MNPLPHHLVGSGEGEWGTALGERGEVCEARCARLPMVTKISIKQNWAFAISSANAAAGYRLTGRIDSLVKIAEM